MTTPNVSSPYWSSVLTQTAVQTSNYTASPNQIVPVDTTSGSVTVTLPTGAPAGTLIAVKMVTLGGSNTVTVTSVSGDVFNKHGGGTTLTLSLSSQGALMEYQAGIWIVLSDDLPLGQLDLRYLPLPSGTATSGYVPVATGTGQASAWSPASAASLPLTTLGDTLYENATPTPARLAGNTSATKNYLTQTGNGTISAAPAWGTIAAGDVPTLNQNTTGTAAGLSSTLALASGGTGTNAGSANAAYNALSPMTTTGDLEYESGASTASRLAGPTSATKQFLTSTGTGSAAQAPAWGTIAAADLPTGTTSTKGALQLDGTAGDIAPDGIQTAGAVGKTADAGHIHQNNADLSLYLAPTGATGETYPRRNVSNASGAPTSGTLYVSAIPLPTGLAVNNITFCVNGTATTATDVTHGWYVLLDSNRVVRAVSADQTGGTTWNVTNTAVTLSVSGSAYTTTYSGLYYIGVMVAVSAGSTPTWDTMANLSGNIQTITPILCGASSASQTTAPSTGATMGAITGSGIYNLYGYTS